MSDLLRWEIGDGVRGFGLRLSRWGTGEPAQGLLWPDRGLQHQILPWSARRLPPLLGSELALRLEEDQLESLEEDGRSKAGSKVLSHLFLFTVGNHLLWAGTLSG